jgi:phage shock protein A
MTRVNNAYSIDSAKSQFEAAKNAIQARQLKARALSELSEDRSEQLAAQLDEMALDDEVSRRLAMLTGQGGGSANLPLPDLDFEKRLPQ